MPEYKNLDLSERFERVVENIKADNDIPDIENCREFYYLFNETAEQLQLTQSELIAIGVDKRTRAGFTLALLNISKFANGSENHLLDNDKMLDKTINSIIEFTINLNNYLSEKDIQEKGKKMSVLAETTQSMEQILNEKYRVVFKLDVIGEVYVSNWMNYEGAEDFLEMVGANLGWREFDFKFIEPESDLYQKLDGTIVSENATEIKSPEDMAVVKEMSLYVRDKIRNSGNEEKIMKIFNDLRCCSIDVNYKNGIISFTTPKSHENYISKTLKMADVDYDVKNIADTLFYVVPLSPRELKVDDVVFVDVDNTLRDGVMEEITMNVINKMPERVKAALALKEKVDAMRDDLGGFKNNIFDNELPELEKQLETYKANSTQKQRR